MTPRRLALVIVAIGLLLLIGLGGSLGVMVLANGVLATAEPAWSTEVRWAGLSVRVSVPGLVRLATAPGVSHLVDGHSLQTSAGRIAFRRDGAALIARCAPCRWQHDALASAPLVLTGVELRAERSGALVTGWLSVDQMRAAYTAELAADGIRVRWQLPPTELSRAYAALATVVPEVAVARIEGTARGGRTAAVAAAIRVNEVSRRSGRSRRAGYRGSAVRFLRNGLPRRWRRSPPHADR